MTTASFQSDSVQLPYVVRLLGALTGEQITPRECVKGLRVAALEDSVKKLFHKTTWAKVEAGDTVLTADSDEIIQVTVQKVSTKPLTEKGPDMVFVHYLIGYAPYRVTRKPDETAYVQSRF